MKNSAGYNRRIKWPKNLSEMHRSVAELVVAGNGRKEIAGTLGVSVSLVHLYKSAVCREFGVKGDLELCRLWYGGLPSKRILEAKGIPEETHDVVMMIMDQKSDEEIIAELDPSRSVKRTRMNLYKKFDAHNLAGLWKALMDTPHEEEAVLRLVI